MGAYVVLLFTALPPELVGLPGFEPGTSSSRTKRATKLRYSPQRENSQPDNPSRRLFVGTKP